jgi:hypothetical protein
VSGPFLDRDYSHYVQLESAFNTSPGALVGADAFKCQTAFPFKRIKARMDRDKDKDNNQASVVSTQGGREKSSWQIEGSVIPSGNSSTPTEPDMDPILEAHAGSKHKATAHTTLAAGSTATVLNFTPGGVAASGVVVGDIILVDVGGSFGFEARQITNIATDAVTVHQALSGAPAAAQTVKVGTTYHLSEAQLKTLHLWEYLNGDNFRHKAGGCIPRNLELSIDGGQENPETRITVSGEGAAIATHSTSIPTPTTAGERHEPTEAKVWIGATLLCLVSASLKSDNGVELRESEFCTLIPTGVKRTGNSGRYMVTQDLTMLLLTGAIEGYFDNASGLTAYDVLVQLGIITGKTVVWRTPKFVPDVEVDSAADEASLSLSGRCYATASLDDEFSLAFI